MGQQEAATVAAEVVAAEVAAAEAEVAEAEATALGAVSETPVTSVPPTAAATGNARENVHESANSSAVDADPLSSSCARDLASVRLGDVPGSRTLAVGKGCVGKGSVQGSVQGRVASGLSEGKWSMGEATVARASDLGANDETLLLRTHLGGRVDAGDEALGYDLESMAHLELPASAPPAVLVCKKEVRAKRQSGMQRRRQRKRSGNDGTSVATSVSYQESVGDLQLDSWLGLDDEEGGGVGGLPMLEPIVDEDEDDD